ncbi:MAG TPA: LuxR C-terminal-related transcriptional regulator, partial [Gammaproteobacteria bacterium]|nr:LuxR C-terminal-related transcriptional regulator [Gammaproteobacteria bacterium]
ARAAFWIGFHLSSLGSAAQATGWLARAERLVEREPACAERGYLLLPAVFRRLAADEYAAAFDSAALAAAIGERCEDKDLVALARNLQGRALLRQGGAERGLALLDEAMLAAASGELSPVVTGIVYCNVIATCQQMHALDRAREWTAALARWCDEQPQLVTFTGLCLVHRCEIMQLSGDWSSASAELREVCEHASVRGDPEVLGDAWYQLAEILRLRGELDDAEAAYRVASDHGREPQPGLALLRLSQGRTVAGLRAVRRVLAAPSKPWQRAQHLPACVEIALAAGELEEARAACDELEDIAHGYGSEILGAAAAHARGAVCFAEGDPRSAVEPLRRALGVWHTVGAPYVAARIRALLGRVYAALGDEEGARLEWEGARDVLARLGAKPDLEALNALDAQPRSRAAAFGLSKRELEVLRLLARGKTNKAIARDLGLSGRTVDRHVSNIFRKLAVESRTAAAAFAYEHRLV